MDRTHIALGTRIREYVFGRRRSGDEELARLLYLRIRYGRWLCLLPMAIGRWWNRPRKFDMSWAESPVADDEVPARVAARSSA